MGDDNQKALLNCKAMPSPLTSAETRSLAAHNLRIATASAFALTTRAARGSIDGTCHVLSSCVWPFYVNPHVLFSYVREYAFSYIGPPFKAAYSNKPLCFYGP